MTDALLTAPAFAKFAKLHLATVRRLSRGKKPKLLVSRMGGSVRYDPLAIRLQLAHDAGASDEVLSAMARELGSLKETNEKD